MKLPLLALFICAVVLIGSSIFLIPTDAPARYNEAQARAAELLDAHEPVRAYKMFKEELGDDQVAGHEPVHYFSDVLYERLGFSALEICDGDFGFACFHGVAGRALGEKGSGAAAELDAICIERYGEAGLGCFHGIGHGLLSYFGYDLEALKESLDACRSLSWRKPLGGCRDGVFMEYNFRPMEPLAELRSRPFSYEARLEPCEHLRDEDRTACYFGLPAWWWHTGGLQTLDAMSQMQAFCHEAEARLVATCIRGIGYMVAPAVRFDANVGGTYCDQLPAENSDRLWCREGLALGMYVDPSAPPSDDACRGGLSTEEQQRCLAEYRTLY